MIESQQSHLKSKPQEKQSFSFMRYIADFVTTLTETEVRDATGPDGMIYFTRETSPKMIHTDKLRNYPSGTIVWLRGTTVERRSWVFESDGPLNGMKPFVYKNGKMDRGYPIEEIIQTDERSVDAQHMTIGSILARVKNFFRETDSVNQIMKLYIGDIMYIRFMDDSRAYSVSVKDSSKMIGNTATAICNVTYEREGTKMIQGKLEKIFREVSMEVVMKLPLNVWKVMFATTVVGGEIKRVMPKEIANIKLRRRKKQITH